MRPWILMAIGATLDLIVAAALIVAGLTLIGAFMVAVAVAGYGFALYLRGNTP